MIADVLAAVAGMIHGGGLVAFALLLNFRRAIPHVRDEDLVRVYRAFGAGFGLSLGVLVFSSLWRWGTQATSLAPEGGHGFLDTFVTSMDGLTTARVATFFALWVSYVALEVWTLEPCRLLDRGEVSDRPAYTAATNRVARHLALNAALFVTVVVLGVLGGKP